MQLQIYKQIHQIYTAIKFAMETAVDCGWTALTAGGCMGGGSWAGQPVADPGDPWGSGPPCPQDFFKSCSFQAILRENPYFEQIWAQGPPLGVKTLLGLPDQNPGSAPDSHGRGRGYRGGQGRERCREGESSQ